MAGHILIAAGGTGGHMFPAQALAEVLLARGWAVELSTDARGARYADGFPEEVAVRRVSAATFARGGALARGLVPLRLLAGIGSAVLALRRSRPAAVIGFGGYPSVPALVAAWILRLPRLIHEANGVPGRVNRIFARRVDAIACGTWPADFPAGTPAHDVGNPVRAAVHERAGAGYIAPGDYPMHLLVIGGSQGARVLSETVPGAVARLPEELRANLRVAHQARPEDVARVEDAYAYAGVAAEVAEFFPDVARRLSEAQLVISRAGASSVADIGAIGRPAILIPFAAAADDHQSANARPLMEAEAAVRIPESALSAEVLAENISAVLTNPDAAARMAANALTVGRPDAAERLADLVDSVAGRR